MADATPVDPNRLHPAPRPVTPIRSARGVGSPATSTRLIGRAQEVAALCALLQEPGRRLVTVTGPGGAGKTRLALAVAEAAAADFGDGAAFAALDAIGDPALILPTVAHVLELQETPGRAPRDTVIGALRDRHLLLVLDNVEHLTGASTSADLAALFAACPGLTVLATSRTPLRLHDEGLFAVPALALPRANAAPDPAALIEFGAIALFVERARLAHHGFGLNADNGAAVVEICRRLDGLPLAIELAAAWIRTLPPATLLARLEQRLPLLTRGPKDAPDRLRTMRNAIAWTYDLLSAQEQALFRRLAVFAGGFTLEAAERVAGAGDLDLVAALVDHSILRRTEQPGEEPRYAMLETVREYGMERLAASGEDAATYRRHAAYSASLAEAALGVLWSSLPGAAQVTWLDRLEREHPNLRAALAWASRHDAETAVRLAGALSYFWWQRGHLREGMGWTQRALALRDAAPAPLQARALYAASLLTGEHGDYAHAAELAEEALTLYRALDDRDGMRRCLQGLGIAAMEMGQFERAAALFEELLVRARELGHVRAISTALAHLGGVAIKRGEFDRARSLLTEAVALGRQYDDRFALAWFLFKLGELERGQGNVTAAIAHVQESLALYQEFGSTGRAGVCLATLAALAEAGGHAERAVRLLGASEQVGPSESGRVLDVDPADQHRLRARLRALLGEEAFARAWETGRARSLDDAIAEALASTDDEAIDGAATTGTGIPAAASGLTPRERRVLTLLVGGRSDREIADALYISQRTASSHVGSILRKLDVNTRTDAAVRAVRDGLV